MERTITKVERSKFAHTTVTFNVDTGEEVGRTPLKYRYFIYYATAKKSTNYKSITATSEEEAVKLTRDWFTQIDNRRK